MIVQEVSDLGNAGVEVALDLAVDERFDLLGRHEDSAISPGVLVTVLQRSKSRQTNAMLTVHANRHNALQIS